MEWLSDPTIWAGLATLIVLEIVLGIDNLVFIAILADKLPPEQRDRARLIGLSLALIMRLALLASISWIVTLTATLFTLFGMDVSGRDLIFLLGGAFLIFKATTELHERLEGAHGVKQRNVVHAAFWQVIVQIVVLDAVFSLDSVITAVGMVDEFAVMAVAVIIAIGVMMVASGPLMRFVSAHPTVVILCLGFLLMIGFSLVAEGFGLHIPKGYLYAAIGFSILIEAFNQIARSNRERRMTTLDLRERTAATVARLLGGRERAPVSDEVAALAASVQSASIFAPQERLMIEGVLSLAERRVRSVMTPRKEVVWLDLEAPEEELRRHILESGHSRYPLARGSLDNFLGVALAKDILRDLLDTGRVDLSASGRQPLVVFDSAHVLKVMELLRCSPLQMAVVLDEYGTFEGLVTPTDMLEAIAGDFPDEGEAAFAVERGADGSWSVDAQMDIHRVGSRLGVDLAHDADAYSTVGGYVLWHLGRLPQVGEILEKDGLVFEVEMMEGRRIGRVRIREVAGLAA